MFAILCSILLIALLCTGCTQPNYFNRNDTTTVTEIVTEITTEQITTEQITTEEDDHSSGIFPPSVYDYDVTDTILVPENER
jgi:uncharacterized protein YcfL